MIDTPLSDNAKEIVEGGLLQPLREVVSYPFARKLERERTLAIHQLQRLHDAVSNCSLVTGESQTLDIEREKLKSRDVLNRLRLNPDNAQDIAC